ncbi:MAG: efflux RND transporter permease subunit [Bacteroidota bacterium]|nr:efflux RND transporter permease subunit [Bacteroidota bacterium]
MSRFFNTYKSPLAILIAIIIMSGLFVYGKLQTSLFPEITFPKIKVIADADQQPVDQMMLSVTRPLEMAIKKVPDVKTIRSSTSRGSCEISAFMDWKADINQSQQFIESKINEIRSSLPPNTQISVERMNPSILPVIGYTLESKSRSPIDLKYLATYTIKPFLSQVDGVSEIRIIGGKEKEFWVQLNPSRMNMLGITPEIVRTSLNETGFIKSNGYLSDYRLLYLTVTNAMVDDKRKLENLVLSNNGKRIVKLKDIASVEIRDAKEYVKINANGREGILVAVLKQPKTNLIELSKQMQAKLDDLKKTLPSDVKINPYYVQSDFVNGSVKSVSDSVWLGLLLAILVAILFLRSLKASVTILLTIPVTLLLTLIVLYLTGQTFNIMTLGAIAAAIGLIIDDAIVVVEQIHRRHEEQPDEKSVKSVPQAIRYLFPSMVGSSLSTIVIFLPFVLMTGVAGAYFKVMTSTMIITLVCSFFVTWIALPVIYLLLTPGNTKGLPSKTQSGHEVKTQRWVKFFIQRPVLSISFAILLIGSIVLIFPKLETGFLPEMDEGSIVLDYKSPSGTSLEETDRILREVEKMLVKIPEVETYSRRTGTQMGFFITEPNRGDYLIQLKNDRKRTTNEVINDIRTRIEASQPALEIDFGQVIGDMLGDLMESVQPVEVKIFGNDRKKLEELSKQVAEKVSQVEGTADVFNGIVIAGPCVNIQPNETKLAQFGITPSNLQYQLQTALEGNIAGTVYEKERFTNIRLVYPGNSKLSVADINHLQIFLPNGKLTPINELASVNLLPGDAEINRENLQNMGIVTARLSGRDLGSVMNDVQKSINKTISLPQGYSITYGGAFAEQKKSFDELLLILITSSLLVFTLMLFLFRNFSVALAILIVAVLGVSGSLLALFITGIPLNVGSYIGLIMIVGIIGENAIFTFQQFSTMLPTMPVDEALSYAISVRLRPKLMTALGAIIALIPLALGLGTGTQMHQPLAVAVIGGLMVALPLLLIIFPTLLRIIFRKHRVAKTNVKSN